MNSTEKRKVKLAGREFEVSSLPFKKNRVVVPAASYAINAIQRSESAKEPLNVTAIDYIYLAVFEAISFADPTITRDAFDTWCVPLDQMISAVLVVALQTGVLVQKSDGDKNTGEV